MRKKEKRISNFKVFSYPDRENIEDIITADDGIWIAKKKRKNIWRKLMLKLFPKKWYRCTNCGNIYIKGWSDDKALEEYKENFPNDPDLKWDRKLICDDCYKEFKHWLDKLTPEKRENIEFGESLEKLNKTFIEKFVKIFPIHVSGDLSKLNIDNLLKFAKENKKNE